MLSRIEYGAYLQYSPRGTSETSVRSRRARDVVKGGNRPALEDLATRIAAEVANGFCQDWLSEGATLVPVPRSAPLKDKDSLWVPKRICEALLAQGIGAGISECLVRTTAVKKSAFQAPGERVSVQDHYDSFDVESSLIEPGPTIVLVDDFITRGRTFAAACSRIDDAFAARDVRAFAAVRTVGFGEVDELIYPFEGHITFDGNDANRAD